MPKSSVWEEEGFLMLLHEAKKLLDAAFKPETAEPWDKVGLHVACDDECNKVAVALDVSPKNIVAARLHDIDLLVTHHPPFLEPPETFGLSEENTSIAGRIISAALVSNVSLYNAHTNLDKNTQAVDALIAWLGFSRKNNKTCDGYGAFLKTKASTEHLVKHFKEKGATNISLAGQSLQKPENVLYLPGSAGSFVRSAKELNTDLIICGEMGYHARSEAAFMGISTLCIGHDMSEKSYLPYMEIMIEDALSISSEDVFILEEDLVEGSL